MEEVPTIKAIETEYKGYRFRSRLEARWAVFFDAAEISWEYEPEGYELSTGERYLPDFYLPLDDIYVEVKGQKLNDKEKEKLEKFAFGINKSILLVTGILGEGKCEIICYDSLEEQFVWMTVDIFIDSIINTYMTDSCKNSLLFGINEITNRYHTLDRSEKNQYLTTLNTYCPPPTISGFYQHIHVSMSVHQEACIDAMKKARFEYGETPIIKPITEPKVEKILPSKSAPPEPNKPKSQPKWERIKISDEQPETIEEEFEILWIAYPRRRGKDIAFKYYKKTRKKGVSYEIIKQGLEGYLDYLEENKVDEKFIKHGSTWFNQKAWLDFIDEDIDDLTIYSEPEPEIKLNRFYGEPLYLSAEKFLIAHMLRNRNITYDTAGYFGTEVFNTPVLHNIFIFLLEFYEHHSEFNLNEFSRYLNNDPDLTRIVAIIEMMNISEKLSLDELERLVELIKSHRK